VLSLLALARVGMGGVSEPNSRVGEGRGAEGDRCIPGSGGKGGGASLDGGGTVEHKQVRYVG
jgi:hypothetical protein